MLNVLWLPGLKYMTWETCVIEEKVLVGSWLYSKQNAGQFFYENKLDGLFLLKIGNRHRNIINTGEKYLV